MRWRRGGISVPPSGGMTHHQPRPGRGGRGRTRASGRDRWNEGGKRAREELGEGGRLREKWCRRQQSKGEGQGA